MVFAHLGSGTQCYSMQLANLCLFFWLGSVPREHGPFPFWWLGLLSAFIIFRLWVNQYLVLYPARGLGAHPQLLPPNPLFHHSRPLAELQKSASILSRTGMTPESVQCPCLIWSKGGSQALTSSLCLVMPTNPSEAGLPCAWDLLHNGLLLGSQTKNVVQGSLCSCLSHLFNTPSFPMLLSRKWISRFIWKFLFFLNAPFLAIYMEITSSV